MVPGVPHRSRVRGPVIRRSGTAPSSQFGKRATHEIRMWVHAGIEEGHAHEHHKDHGTRKGKWDMVEKKTATQVAARAKRLVRSHVGSTLSARDPARGWR